MTDFVEVVLTCGSWQEAQKVTDALLASKLVACVEQMEISSKNWWKGSIEQNKEVKLIMETVAGKFDAIEAEVKKHHSYDTFVLQMVPIARLSRGAAEWLTETVGDK
ncbi:MAG: divalent cation tolerance protein CutA [Candidatus Saccharibacteria bacterium]